MSTFSKKDDFKESELEHIYSETVLVMSKVTEPSDILWKNMSGNKGIFTFRRVILGLIGVFIILFISSPTTIFANVKKLDKNGVLDFEWVSNTTFLGRLIRQHGPPFIIILINYVLLMIIDITTKIECYETHSLY